VVHAGQIRLPVPSSSAPGLVPELVRGSASYHQQRQPSNPPLRLYQSRKIFSIPNALIAQRDGPCGWDSKQKAVKPIELPQPEPQEQPRLGLG
jgi:hypothetical protein